MAVAAILGTEPFVIPDGIHTLAAFREWVHSADLPENVRIHYLNGHVWVDRDMEEVFSHNRVKHAVVRALDALVRANKLGVVYPDGMLYTDIDADASTGPDAIFVSAESFAEQRVWFESGSDGVATEMLGTPDVVIEVVSRSSIEKDTDWLLETYFTAGIPEYWLIDARDEDDIRFEIFTRKRKAFAAVKHAAGWVPSAVFGKSFLLRRVEEYGMTDYLMDIR